MLVEGATGGFLVVPGGAGGQGWLGDTWWWLEMVVGWERHQVERKRLANRGQVQGLESMADCGRGLHE